jgi:hypothetical protein
MCKPAALIAVAILFVLALFALRGDRETAAQVPPARVQNWQYDTIVMESADVRNVEDLNKKGRQEWDLCGTVSFDKSTVLILKRPLR